MKKILVLIIALHAFILTKLVFFPYPELFVYPYLVNRGLLPYKQIFDQHFPSILMLPINIFHFGLTSPDLARVFLIVLTILSQILLFLVAKRVLKNKKYAILANLIYLVLQPLFDGNILWLDTFLVPVMLLSTYFLLRFLDEKRIWLLALSGFSLGAAVFLKQSALPVFLLVAFAVYFVRKSAKDAAIFFGFGVMPLILLVAWIYQKGILPEFFYWTVRFNFEVYARMARKLPTLKQLARVGIYLLPAIYVLAFKFKKDLKILILGLILFASIIPEVSRFEFVHLQPALPLIVLFIVAFATTAGRKIAVPIITLILLLTAIWLPVFYRGHIGSYVYFFDKDTIASAKIAESLTQPSNPIFVFGPQPVIYPLADRVPPGKIFTITLPWNMSVAGDKILQSIKSDPPKIIIRDASAEIDGKKVVDFASNIENYINANYVKIDQIGANEILVPKNK